MCCSNCQAEGSVPWPRVNDLNCSVDDISELLLGRKQEGGFEPGHCSRRCATSTPTTYERLMRSSLSSHTVFHTVICSTPWHVPHRDMICFKPWHVPQRDMFHMACSTPRNVQHRDMFHIDIFNNVICSTLWHVPHRDMLNVMICSTLWHLPHRDVFHNVICSAQWLVSYWDIFHTMVCYSVYGTPWYVPHCNITSPWNVLHRTLFQAIKFPHIFAG